MKSDGVGGPGLPPGKLQVSIIYFNQTCYFRHQEIKYKVCGALVSKPNHCFPVKGFDRFRFKHVRLKLTRVIFDSESQYSR